MNSISFYTYLCGYLFLLQHMVKARLSSNLLDKLLGKCGKWENGLT